MTDHDDYFQQDIAVGEAPVQGEDHTVRMKLHQSAESHRGASMKASSTSADGAVHFNTYAHLVNVDPDKNRYRFYTLTWQPSLFGGLALVRSWGRIGMSGRSRAIFFADQESAQKTVEEILKRRLGHGYAVVRWE